MFLLVEEPMSDAGGDGFRCAITAMRPAENINF